MRHLHEWAAHVLPALPGRPRRFLEIGTAWGKTMAWLYCYARHSDDDEYVGIDPWSIESLSQDMPDSTPAIASSVEVQARRRLRDTWGERRGALIKGPSSLVLGQPVCESISRGFDLIFIDGLHTSEAVAQDSELAWPFLRADGILSWDDYGRPSRHRRAVAPSVHEFLATIQGQYAEVSKGKAMTIQKVSA